MNTENKNTEIIDIVSGSEIKISNYNLYGTFDDDFKIKRVICVENPNPSYTITVGKIYPVLDVVIDLTILKKIFSF